MRIASAPVCVMLGISWKPPTLDTLILLKQLQNAPEAGKTDHADDGGQNDVGNKE